MAVDGDLSDAAYTNLIAWNTTNNGGKIKNSIKALLANDAIYLAITVEDALVNTTNDIAKASGFELNINATYKK